MPIISNFPMGRGITPITQRISYTGKMLYSLQYMDGVLYHLLTLETSGVLTVDGNIVGDVWMCGGGAGGHYGGGGSGYTHNAFSIPIVSGTVSIGAGGNFRQNGGTTSYNSMSAAGGVAANSTNGGNGGSGGGQHGTSGTAGTGQGTTTRPFESLDMKPQCGAGGAGGWYGTPSYNGGNGGSDGGNGAISVTGTGKGGNGGDGGGFPGGDASYSSPGASVGSIILTSSGFGYGAGGGGVGNRSNNMCGTIASGAPGAVMIRIPA